MGRCNGKRFRIKNNLLVKEQIMDKISEWDIEWITAVSSKRHPNLVRDFALANTKGSE